MQPKIQEDLYIQQRSVKMWCEAMLNLDVDDWSLKLEGVEPKLKFLQCLNN